ncbi:peptidase S8/S53 domain-containing protein [Trichoderma asperelloides]|nr:peptidase S8/S53 domain-containing protein [Trichoderma asperelloides]
MYNTGSSDNINQLYASIEEFDGDIDRLIDNWQALYPSVKHQLETTDELNLMNSFAEILLDSGKLELATSVDEHIHEILESDTESELDEGNRQRLYSLINGRWGGHANSPTAMTASPDIFPIISQQSQAGLWQTYLENKTHKFMYGKDERFFGTNGIEGPAYEPVKIAILDSDISPQHLRPFRMRVKARENFAGGQQNAAHTDHGTTVAELVLKACPTAHVYIGRVTKLNAAGESAVDIEAAAKAIEYAADPKGWGVDIITMSFGWKHVNKRISDALSFAKQHKVLMFASTTNYGFAETNSILYPGRAPEVICVDAAEDTGQLAGFAIEDISQGRIERFSAPGLGIISPISGEAMDGSSFACPIAAGIAALAIEFTRQFPLCDSKSVQEAVQQREGMVKILREISKQNSSSPSKFLCPWELLGDEDGVYGGDGQPGSERYFVAHRFVRILRKEYGPHIGREIFYI